MDYVLINKRRPSKHIAEDRRLHHWIKYNKRCLEKGLLTEDRATRFVALLHKMAQYRRVNQHSYVTPIDTKRKRPRKTDSEA